jgi:hypothetical protein
MTNWEDDCTITKKQKNGCKARNHRPDRALLPPRCRLVQAYAGASCATDGDGRNVIGDPLGSLLKCSVLHRHC